MYRVISSLSLDTAELRLFRGGGVGGKNRVYRKPPNPGGVVEQNNLLNDGSLSADDGQRKLKEAYQKSICRKGFSQQSRTETKG